MQFATWMPARVDWQPVVRRAEELGFGFVHQADSQMLYADPVVSLTLCATATSRIRLGAGVTNPLTRTAPAMAASLASLNLLAPGRVFLAIGSGYTCMAAMGMRSATVAELGDYVRVVRALLRGEVTDYTLRGQTRPIQMLNGPESLDPTFVNLAPVPIYIAAHGPRMLELAGELADGLILGVVRPTERYLDRTRAALQRGADKVGRRAEDIPIYLMLNMYVRAEDEAFGSDDMKRAVLGLEQSNIGVYAAARRPQPGAVDPIGDDGIPELYRALALRNRVLTSSPDGTPWYLTAYDGHGWRVRPELLSLVPDDLLRSRALIGTADEIIGQIRIWDGLGVSSVGALAQGDVALAAEQIERFGRGVIARY